MGTPVPGGGVPPGTRRAAARNPRTEKEETKMANARFFKIRWAGEGAPSLPVSFYRAMEGMCVENVYNANNTAIPLD